MNEQCTESFDPYYKWLGIPPEEQPPNHYRLLGVTRFESDPDVIESAADQRMSHVRTFQMGKHGAESQRLLNEIAAARMGLLDPDGKKSYDDQLRRRVTSHVATSEADASGPDKTPAWPCGKIPSTVDEFAACVAASRLLTPDQIREFRKTLPADAQPRDAREFARLLVDARKITRFQAAALYQGRHYGLVFGEYVVLNKLGAGGMGQVYVARQRRLDRLAAIKVLPSEKLSCEDAVQRFQHEVRTAAKLSHPNIVITHDAGEENGIHYLVMEYVDGGDLAELLQHQGPLPVTQAVNYIVQAAAGLAYAHEQGIVHRDVKPSNLILDSRGTVKVLDLGLARLREEPLAQPLTSQSEQASHGRRIMGTVDYMSPEQAEDTTAADHRSDIYGLGCTLYRLLTGEAVYPRESTVQKLAAHRDAPIPSLCAKRPDVPRELDGIFRRMVAKRPDDRYASMADVVAALRAVLDDGAAISAKTDGCAKAWEKRQEQRQLVAVGANEHHHDNGGTACLVEGWSGTPLQDRNAKAIVQAHTRVTMPLPPVVAPVRAAVLAPPAGNDLRAFLGSIDRQAGRFGTAPPGLHHKPAKSATSGRHKRDSLTPRLVLATLSVTAGLLGIAATVGVLLAVNHAMYGTLAVVSQGHRARVAVRKDGNVVVIADTVDRWRIRLESGTYQVQLLEGSGHLELSASQIMIAAGERMDLTVFEPGILSAKPEDDRVAVAVEQHGEPVGVIERSNQWQLRLRPGTYQVKLCRGGDTFTVSRDSVVVRAGEQTILKVIGRFGDLAVLPEIEGAEVAVTRDGRLIAMIGDRNGWEAKLPPGSYQVELRPDNGRFQLDRSHVVVMAGERTILNTTPLFGDLVVQTNDDTVQLIIRQDGTQIGMIGRHNQWRMGLKPGRYQVTVFFNGTEVKSTEKMVLVRAGMPTPLNVNVQRNRQSRSLTRMIH